MQTVILKIKRSAHFLWLQKYNSLTSEFHFSTYFLFLPGGKKKKEGGPPSEAEGK